MAGALLARDLRRTMAAITAVMAVIALTLIAAGGSIVVAALAVLLWGVAFGFIPVGWSTWLTQAVPDEAESGGGLLVAVIQVAVSSGAALGGVMFDLHGASGAFEVSALLMAAATLVILFGLPARAARTLRSAEA